MTAAGETTSVKVSMSKKRAGTKQDMLFDAALVQEEHGVRPNQLVDFLSLVGDDADNLAGSLA